MLVTEQSDSTGTWEDSEMSFADWMARHDRSFVTSKGGLIVYCRYGDDGYTDLFHLSDYALSTVSGPCVYLMPRL
jgi:hypothetical protein